MLSQRFRFHGHGSLNYLYRNGRTLRTPEITVRYLENPHRVHSRYTVIISKKVLKRAVARNRLRRRIYEIIRKEKIHTTPGFDVALSVFKGDLLEIPHEELKQKILSAFKNAKLTE